MATPIKPSVDEIVEALRNVLQVADKYESGQDYEESNTLADSHSILDRCDAHNLGAE